MERLTVNDLNKVCYDPWELCGMDNYCKRGCHEEGGCTKGCHIMKMYRKLAEYEDLDEEGCLLMLPCAIGDTVHAIFCGEIYEKVIRGILFTENKILAQDENGNILGEFEGTLFIANQEAEWIWKGTEDKNVH